MKTPLVHLGSAVVLTGLCSASLLVGEDKDETREGKEERKTMEITCTRK